MKNINLFEVIYINLTESVDRNIHMVNQLDEIGIIDAVRFPAEKVDGGSGAMTAGEVGCFKSHFHILDQMSRVKPTVVLEDDVVLPSTFISDVNKLIGNFALHDLDVVFISHCGDLNNLNKLLQLLKIYKEAMSGNNGLDRRYLLVSKDFYSSGTAGYIINPKSIEKIRFLLKAACANGIKIPIDILYSKLIAESKLKAVIAFPYLLHPSPKFKSTISGRMSNGRLDLATNDLYCLLSCLFSQNRLSDDFECLNDVGMVFDAECDVNERLLMQLYSAFIKSHMSHNSVN
jgi:GR25 family glycosyltransferase involved in LPS biosynthesis